MKKVFKFSIEILNNFDLFGHGIELDLHSKPLVKSTFSAIFSIAIMAICSYSLSINIVSWVSYSNMQTISSSINLNINDFLIDNKNVTYSLSYKNYNIYFGLSPSSVFLPFEEIRKYVTQTIMLDDQPLEIEECLQSKMNEFLLENQIDTSANQTITSSICIKNESYTLGLYSDEKDLGLDISEIIYTISRCQNSTNQDYYCASNEEIDQMIPQLSVQVSLPRSFYDFNQPQNPRKRLFDYKIFNMDQKLVKSATAFLSPVYLYRDQGWFTEDYVPQSLDFNVDTYTTDVGSQTSGNQVLFQQFVTLGLNQQIYYQKNQKVLELVASFGGTINVFLIFGKLICFTYNLLILKHKLINISFSNLENAGEFKK